MSAIYKDTIFTSTASTLDYQIKSGDVILYTGKATKMPDEDECIINVSQICQNYMKDVLPDIKPIENEVILNEGAALTFDIYSSDILLESYDFIWDWTYESEGEYGGKTFPINGKADIRQKLLYSYYSTGETITTSLSSGFNVWPNLLTFYWDDYGFDNRKVFSFVYNKPYSVRVNVDWLTVEGQPSSFEPTQFCAYPTSINSGFTREAIIEFVSFGSVVQTVKCIQRTQVFHTIFYTTLDEEPITFVHNPFDSPIRENVYENGMGKIVFDYPITEIPEGAFRGTKLTNIEIPENVTWIRSDAFRDCIYLTSLEIPFRAKVSSDFIRFSNVTYIYFRNPEGDWSVGTVSNISENVNRPLSIFYPYGADYGNMVGGVMKSWVVPTSIDFAPFIDKAIVIPNNVLLAIASIDITENRWGASGIRSIYQMGLNVFVFDGDITRVPTDALIGGPIYAEPEKTIAIPETVTYVDDYAFRDVELLRIYAYPETAPTLGNNVFYNIPESGILHYHKGSDYSSWIEALPEGWVAIGDLDKKRNYILNMEEEIKEFPAGLATWVRDAADLSGKIITFNDNVTYDVSYCGDYALYYLNSYGGWDAFLFERPVKRIDELESLTYERYADNNTINYGTNKYQVNVQPTYQCNTGYLTDEQAENFAKNLLSTTKAYFHNLKDNTIVPVMVDSTSAEYKTFKNNGRKLITYTFTIRESQNKIRR